MRALVLSGGGCKGAFQVGVLTILVNAGLEWEYMSGVSVGALNVSVLAQSKYGNIKESFKRLDQLWHDIVGNSSVWKHWFLFGPVAGLWKHSFVNSEPLTKMIETNIDVSMIKNSGRKVRFGAVAYDSGRYFEATEEYDNLHQWIAASAAFPGILCPQEIYGDLWVDGGVRRITPLKGAIDAGADEIDVIVSSPRTPNSMLTGEQKNANAINVVLRSIELMSDELFARDIDFADLYNDLIKQGIMIPGKRQVKINVYEPKEQFTKGELGSLQFDPKHILEMIEKGKQVKI